MSFSCIFLVTVVVVCSRLLLTTGQLNTPPPCQVALTQQCSKGAIQAAAATGCNWHLVIPAMQTCIYNALLGCKLEVVLIFQQLVSEYNTTLQLDSCNPSCTNQTLRGTNMQQCFIYSGGQIEDLVSAINQQPSQASSLCPTLSSMSACLLNSTAGCPALMDITYGRINDANGSYAYAICNIAPFQAPTTNAPVGLLNTDPLTLPTSTSTTTAGVSMDQGQLVLIILGAIVITATLIVIMVLLVLIIKRRQTNRPTHVNSTAAVKKEWRPYGAKVYSNLPQATIVRPAQEHIIYRPLNYTSNAGFFNEAVQRD